MLLRNLSQPKKVCGQTHWFHFSFLGLFMVLSLGLQFSKLLISLLNNGYLKNKKQQLSTTVTCVVLSKALAFGEPESEARA